MSVTKISFPTQDSISLSKPISVVRRQKPRILILISLGWGVRNYLRSEVLDLLKREADVIVAIPHEDAGFREEFKGHVADIVLLPPNTAERLTAPLRRLVDQSQLRRNGSNRGTHRKKWIASVFNTPRWKRVLQSGQDSLARVVAWDPLFRLALAAERQTINAMYRKSEHAQLLDEVMPALVVSTFPFSSYEYPVITEANRRNIPTSTAILSWDNLSTRGRIIGEYDKYLLWSEIMRDDLLRLYTHIAHEKAVITGTPQFDFFMRPGELWEWEPFCQRLDLDSQRTLLTYTCVSHRMVPGEHKLVLELYDALMNANLPRPVQLLVRPHPLGDFNLFKKLGEGRPHLRVSRPWENDQTRYGWFCPSEDQLSLLTNTIYHSAIGFNIRSTMTLDFCIFNRPVINVAFGQEGDTEEDEFIRDFYQYGYYQPVMKTKAGRMAYSLEEIVRHTRDYLENPDLDSKNRTEVVNLLCGTVDGQAGRRVAESLLEILKGRSTEV